MELLIIINNNDDVMCLQFFMPYMEHWINSALFNLCVCVCTFENEGTCEHSVGGAMSNPP